MRIIFDKPYTSNKPAFTSIKKEQILALRAEGLLETEIPKRLGVTVGTYYYWLKKYGLTTKLKQYQNELGKISKEEFETHLKKKTPIEEICRIFKITTTAYYNLLEKFGLRGYIAGTNKKAVTKEHLQELVDKGLSIDEICKELKIGKDAYYELVQKFDIMTSYRKSRKRIEGITKDMITSLMAQGKTYSEIAENLQIPCITLRNLISGFHIETKFAKTKELTGNITKEQLETLINSGKSRAEIINELGIDQRTYTDLLNKLGIETKLMKIKKNIAEVTKEDLQKLVDEGLTKEEICRRLHLSGETILYRLLKRLDIRYNYVHHANEIYIPKEKLEETVKNWKSSEAASEELGVADVTFYEKARLAKVKTVLRDSIDEIKSYNPEEIQQCLNEGASRHEICEKFGISGQMYSRLERKYNLVSNERKNKARIAQITKEQLEALINSGKSTKEICEELQISCTTYIKKLHKFGLREAKG